MVRLRQAVLVAEQLEPAAEELHSQLGLHEPYRDPGVGAFGLHNVVFALGDCFLEVVSPTQEGTTAGRYLERRGDGGYMLIFQLDDLDAARARARAMGIRTVWQLDLPDISGTHLHPADTRGAIVSLDRADPPGSWRWGGPDWTEKEGGGAPGALAGVTVAVTEPEAVAERWGKLLDVAVGDNDGAPALHLDGACVAFAPAASAATERLVEIDVALPPKIRAERAAVEIAGATFRLRDQPVTAAAAP